MPGKDPELQAHIARLSDLLLAERDRVKNRLSDLKHEQASKEQAWHDYLEAKHAALTKELLQLEGLGDLDP